MSKPIICWTDIPVTDLKRAADFYSKVLSAPLPVQKEGDMQFALLPNEGDNMCGCLAVCTDTKPSRTGVLIYLSVEGRLDEAVRIAGDNGAEILEPSHQIGPYGFRAVIIDTEGNRIALHSMK